MNPQLPLYQFVHDHDRIAIARISGLEIKPSLRDGQERVSFDLNAAEYLAGPAKQTIYSYSFDRPRSRHAQLKFPDPTWGRVDLRPGAEVLLVTAGPNSNAQDPVYADGIPSADDPVLRSIREVLKLELASQSEPERFEHRLRWLLSGDTIEKLFAGEGLAKDTPSADELARLLPAYARAFSDEHDPYVAISLGTWLWRDLYPRADKAGQIAIVNATIAVASSEEANARSFAVDRLSGCDPSLLTDPAIKPSSKAITQLEDRRASEPDAATRQSLDRIIHALQR